MSDDQERLEWQRWVGILLILAAFSTATYSAVSYYEFRNASPAHRLQRLWEKDLETLRDAGKLHPAWNRIRTTEVFTGTERAKRWLTQLRNPVPTYKDGDHKLEILLLSWDEDGQLGAIVQYNLVDEKSGNMIWELGRTFVLEGKDERKPAQAHQPRKNSDE